jgi:regulatory protein
LDKSILKKACSFCVYQERTQAEVRQRLAEWKVWGDDAEEIIAWLITENFVNEERFARVFAGSKFRVKHWGRRKIVFELKARKLSEYCIKMALTEIGEEEYKAKMEFLWKRKAVELKNEPNGLQKKQKMANYLIGKGFETEQVWASLKGTE